MLLYVLDSPTNLALRERIAMCGGFCGFVDCFDFLQKSRNDGMVSFCVDCFGNKLPHKDEVVRFAIVLLFVIARRNL